MEVGQVLVEVEPAMEEVVVEVEEQVAWGVVRVVRVAMVEPTTHHCTHSRHHWHQSRRYFQSYG